MSLTTLPRVSSTPTDYTALFSEYYDYVVNLVGKFGIDRQNAEDVAMTILTKFYEKDALAHFDPDYMSSHAGKAYKAQFRTFLSGFVSSYVRHYVERQRTTAHREAVILDTPVSTSDGHTPSTLRDFLQQPYVEEFEELNVADLVKRIYDRLALCAPRNQQDRCNLPLFFSAVLAQITETGTTNVPELATMFGMSTNTIQTWLKRLRAEVAEVL